MSAIAPPKPHVPAGDDAAARAASPALMRRRRPSLLLIAANLGAVAALLAPMIAGAEPGAPHQSDAPLLLALTVPALLAVVMGETTERRLDAKGVALLGVLCGLNAMLRVPGAVGGASLIFALPIVCGAVFGPAFGFLLGSLSFAVSGIVTAGVGPWLPFQMFAAGWVGAGAGLLRPAAERVRPVAAVALLCVYGYLAGFVFGAVTDLWFWPYLAAGDSSIGWRAGMGASDALAAFRRFYMATSFAWDAGRAFGNAILIAAVGLPAMRLLRRWRDRMWTGGAQGGA